MAAKEIIKIIILLGILYLVAKAITAILHAPTTDVTYATPVAGLVTGEHGGRQYYVHHLNGDTKAYYDFNRFGPAWPLPPGLSQEEINARNLGRFLRLGDQILKPANSITLSVRRGKTTTKWVCSPSSGGN